MLAACMAVTSLAAAAVVEKPSAMPDAMGCIVVSDLHGFIDGVGSVAAQVAPMMNGMMIKNMIGVQLGDPGLAGIAPGKGLAVVIMDQTNAFAVVEAEEAQLAAYANALGVRDIRSKVVDGVLVVAKTADQVDKGSVLVPEVKEKLLARRSPDLRLVLQPAALIEKNDAQIQSMLQLMPMMMGMSMQQAPGMDMNAIQSMARMLEAEVRVLLSLARQCDTAAVVLTPQKGSLAISQTLVAKEGTHLSTLLAAPKTAVENPKLRSGLLGDAAVAIDATMGNPAAVTDFLVAETDQLIREMNLQDVDVAGIVSSLKKWMAVYSGSFCETFDFGGESGFTVSYAMAVKDEGAALTLFKTMQEDLGPFIRMYETMGMPMTMEFKENVREHQGVAIHQFKVVMSLEQLPQEQRAQMEGMNLTNMVYDVAIVNGCMLYSMGAGKMETLIDRIMDEAFTASPLKARGVYPAGAFYYCDFDAAKYMAFAASMMPPVPDNPLPQIAAMLKGSDPITSAGFREDGAVMWSVNIPGALIGKIGQAAMMIQMRQVQQGGAPQPVIEEIAVPAP
jgi:hypothetical protein